MRWATDAAFSYVVVDIKQHKEANAELQQSLTILTAKKLLKSVVYYGQTTWLPFDRWKNHEQKSEKTAMIVVRYHRERAHRPAFLPNAGYASSFDEHIMELLRPLFSRACTNEAGYGVPAKWHSGIMMANATTAQIANLLAELLNKLEQGVYVIRRGVSSTA